MRLYDYAASANCYKVRLLLAQQGRPYELVPIDIFSGETLEESFRAVSPMGTTPVLELDDGRLLTESAAILWFLGEGTRFIPEDDFERAQVIRWLAFEQADIVAAVGGLRFRLLTGRLAAGNPDARSRRSAGEEILAALETHLGASEFLVGSRYTIADIAVFGYVHVAHEAQYDLGGHPSLLRWLERVRAQPGFLDDLKPYPSNARPGAGRSIYG